MTLEKLWKAQELRQEIDKLCDIINTLSNNDIGIIFAVYRDGHTDWTDTVDNEELENLIINFYQKKLDEAKSEFESL